MRFRAFLNSSLQESLSGTAYIIRTDTEDFLIVDGAVRQHAVFGEIKVQRTVDNMLVIFKGHDLQDKIHVDHFMGEFWIISNEGLEAKMIEVNQRIMTNRITECSALSMALKAF